MIKRQFLTVHLPRNNHVRTWVHGSMDVNRAAVNTLWKWIGSLEAHMLGHVESDATSFENVSQRHTGPLRVGLFFFWVLLFLVCIKQRWEILPSAEKNTHHKKLRVKSLRFFEDVVFLASCASTRHQHRERLDTHTHTQKKTTRNVRDPARSTSRIVGCERERESKARREEREREGSAKKNKRKYIYIATKRKENIQKNLAGKFRGQFVHREHWRRID